MIYRKLTRALACLSAVFLISANAEESPFVVGLSSSPSTADPHFSNAAPDFNLGFHLYETIFQINQYTSDLDYVLATDITLVNPTTWEIGIKQGVKFHDGSEMTSADIIYSLNRVSNHPDFDENQSPMQYYMRGIKSLEALNDYRIRVVTAQPNHDITFGMNRIGIIKKPDGGKPLTRAAFDSGEAAIGTGPYRLASFSPELSVLTRFDQFHANPPDVGEVELRYVPEVEDRIKLLKRGELHLIEKVSPDYLKQSYLLKGFKVSNISSHRLMFLSMYAGQEPRDVFEKGTNTPLTKNPLADIRVRRAISLAIDRKHLAEDLLNMEAGVAHQFVLPSITTYNPTIPEQVYDVTLARELLEEAGYPNGFKVVMYGPNDRYVLDETMLANVSTMLAKIGIEAVAISIPKNRFFKERAEHRYAISYAGYNTDGRAIPLLNALIHSNDDERKVGERNYSAIKFPEIDELLQKAESTLEPAIQRRYVQRAAALGMEVLTTIPLYFEPTIWASHPEYEYWANPNDRTVTTQVRKR